MYIFASYTTLLPLKTSISLYKFASEKEQLSSVISTSCRSCLCTHAYVLRKCCKHMRTTTGVWFFGLIELGWIGPATCKQCTVKEVIAYNDRYSLGAHNVIDCNSVIINIILLV